MNKIIKQQALQSKDILTVSLANKKETITYKDDDPADNRHRPSSQLRPQAPPPPHGKAPEGKHDADLSRRAPPAPAWRAQTWSQTGLRGSLPPVPGADAHAHGKPPAARGAPCLAIVPTVTMRSRTPGVVVVALQSGAASARRPHLPPPWRTAQREGVARMASIMRGGAELDMFGEVKVRIGAT